MVICENIFTQLVKKSKETTRSVFPVNIITNYRRFLLTNTSHQFCHILHICKTLFSISFQLTLSIYLIYEYTVNYLVRFIFSV